MLFLKRREGAPPEDEESRGEDRQIAVFLVGLVLLSPLVLALFDHPNQTIAGIPSLYFFLFAVWGLLIAAMALIVESAPDEPFSNPSDEAGPQP